MEDPEGIESLNDWEQVQLENNPQDSLSIFPPSSHEGLQIPPPHSQPSTQPSSADGYNADDEEDLPSDSNPEAENEIGKRLRLRLDIFRSGIVWIASRARGVGGLWSFASVSLVVAAAVLFYSRVQRWRQWVRKERENRLALVIKEKDQKINQLCLQIAQMNEMLSERRKVPVVRVS